VNQSDPKFDQLLHRPTCLAVGAITIEQTQSTQVNHWVNAWSKKTGGAQRLLLGSEIATRLGGYKRITGK